MSDSLLKTLRDVRASEFRDLISKENGQLIDVRTATEYQSGKLHGAINMDIMSLDFTLKTEQLDKQIPVLVYCHSGARSYSAAKYMVSRGFHEVINLAGGVSNWPYELE